MKKNFYITGTIFIFLLGSLFHFTYNNTFLTSIFSATNESVFEHTKLLIYPTLIYFITYYFLNKKTIKKDSYFSGIVYFLLSSILFIILFFYFITYGLNIKATIIHILSFLLAVIIGFIYFKKCYTNNKIINYYFYIPTLLLLYIDLTINPLPLPMFIP